MSHISSDFLEETTMTFININSGEVSLIKVGSWFEIIRNWIQQVSIIDIFGEKVNTVEFWQAKYELSEI